MLGSFAVTMTFVLVFGLPRSRRPFDDYVAQLRRDGEPVTCEELWGPRPPDAVNAAAGIEEAIAARDRDHGPPSKWNVPGPWHAAGRETDGWRRSMTPDDLRRLTAHVESLRPFFDAVDAALERPRFVLRRETAGPKAWDEQPPRWDVYAGAAVVDDDVDEMLHVRAHHAATADERLAARRTMLRIASRIEVGSLREALVAAGVRHYAYCCLGASIRDAEIDARSARAALDPLIAQDFSPQLNRGIRALSVETLDWYARFVDREPRLLSPKTPDRMIRRNACEVMRRCGGPWSPEDATDAAGEVVTTSRRLREAAAVPLMPYATSHERCSTLLDADHGAKNLYLVLLTRSLPNLRRIEAEARLARVGLALAEFRAMHDDYPASLDDLRPSFPDGVPIDPFTEAPFGYVRTATGMRLSSPGCLPGEKLLPDDEHGTREIAWELPR